MNRRPIQTPGSFKSYGKESHLAYLGYALVDSRNGLISATMAIPPDGYAEHEAALLLLE